MTNWLVSYPRSGNTWYRYCIEYLSKCPTKGYDHKLKGGKKTIDEPLCNFATNHVNLKNDFILVKRHELPNMEEDDKVILLLRNPKEVIIRHFRSMPQKDINHVLNAQVDWYFSIIRGFDSINKQKMVVYYEDLITNIAPVLKKSIQFLDISDAYYQPFMDSIGKHRAQGLKVYGNQFPSMTKGRKVLFHSNSVNKDVTKKIENRLKEKSPELYTKYLGRYK